MKKFTQTFVALSLSFLTTGAFGQIQSRAHAMPAAGHLNLRNHHPVKPGADTITSLPYNSMDSIQLVAIPINPISIPSSARGGWNFGINVTVKGSKQDSVGVFYWSQWENCTNFEITSAHTTVGEFITPEAPNVNSFVTGYSWYNSTDFSGNDSVITWPDVAGPLPGKCIGGNYIWYNLIETNCTDTCYFPVQDLGIMASIKYNSGSNALIDYPYADQVISGASNFVWWEPGLYMNADYVLADTTYSPFTNYADANYTLVNNATVTFDTAWDYYSQGYVNAITPGSVSVDTLWAYMEYRNTSSTNDTIIFQVVSVNSSGYPAKNKGRSLSSNQIYGVDTMILNAVTTAIPAIAKAGISVNQNYPNPFNKTTQITYTLDKSSDVTFSVSDITGRTLVNNIYSNSAPGEHTINLSASTLSPGVYFYTFNVAGIKVTKKMVITE
jgi:hypothetical protein